MGMRPYWQLAGGLGLIVVALLVFAVHVSTPLEKQMSFPIFICTIVSLIMIAISVIGNAIWILRTPSRLELRPDGILFISPIACEQFPWGVIGRVETDKREWPMVGKEVRLLVIYGTTGKKLITVTDRIRNFDQLLVDVQSRLRKTHNQPIVDARLRRSKLMALMFFGFGVFSCVAVVFLGVDGWRTRTNLALLHSNGHEIQAKIKRHYIFNVTPRIEYVFEATDGSMHSRNTEMTRAAWNETEDCSTVAVRFVPSNPDFSRLVEGEGDRTFDNWKMSLTLSAAGSIVTIIFILAAILRWNGCDITYDSEMRKFRLEKFGEQPRDDEKGDGSL